MKMKYFSKCVEPIKNKIYADMDRLKIPYDGRTPQPRL